MHTARRLSTSVMVLLLVSAMASCSDEQSPDPPPAESVAPTRDVVANQQRHQEEPLVLPNNPEQLLGRLTFQDRKRVESFYGNYGGTVMAFDNPKELRWMQRHGYPLPEDILEASRQTDDELRSRFQRGDAKAGYFMLDRMAGRSDNVGSADENLFADRVIATGGPFAGYAYYRYYSQIKGEWEFALAGLLWADFQGDWRAKQYFDQLVPTGGQFHQKLGRGEVAGAYQAVLVSVRNSNPTLLSTPIDARLKYWAGRR